MFIAPSPSPPACRGGSAECVQTTLRSPVRPRLLVEVVLARSLGVVVVRVVEDDGSAVVDEQRAAGGAGGWRLGRRGWADARRRRGRGRSRRAPAPTARRRRRSGSAPAPAGSAG